MNQNYDYNLPKELIANTPAFPRHSSRLLVYNTKTDEVILDTFENIAKYIPAESAIVLNNTKVVPSRLALTKLTGGVVKILFLMNEWDGGEMIKGLPDKGLSRGERLYLDTEPVVEVVSNVKEEFTLKLLVPPTNFAKICERYGQTPLPPYIKSDLKEEELRDRYQTAFAESPSSVAAPTASLHFTPAVFKSLDSKNIGRVAVTLHVGRGTFSPVSKEAEASGKLHPEPIHISHESSLSISRAKQKGSKIIAAGTTALRLLESAADQILAGKEFKGETTLFVKPPYTFKIADGLITNFHLPNTSLIMLLDAFMENKGAKKSWRDLYELAIREKFRFYSFGDAMLII